MKAFRRLQAVHCSLPSSLRLAIIIAVAFGVLLATFFILSHQMLSFSRNKILDERQVIAEMTARQIDGFLVEVTDRLDDAASSLPRDVASSNASERTDMLSELLGHDDFFFMEVRVHDTEGRLILDHPPNRAPRVESRSDLMLINYVIQFRRGGISDPFIVAESGAVAAEVATPLLDVDGVLWGILSAVVDLGSTGVVGSLNQARDLGETGHADLVDIQGRVLASTESGQPLRPADHLEFYRRMALLRVPSVETVPHESTGLSDEGSEHHVMAFAPLLEADWGVAVGGDEAETFEATRRLRNRVYAIGGAAAAAAFVASLAVAAPLTRRDGRGRAS